jgi:hypothetical protein
MLDGLDSTSFLNTSSFNTVSSSFAGRIVSNEAKTGSYATTGSNQLNGNQTITGSLTATGTITAQTLVVQTITSSVEYVSGSNRFGSTTGNTHEFTGSILVSGSQTINGDVIIGSSGNSNTLNINSDTSTLKISGLGFSQDRNYGSLEFYNTDTSQAGPNIAAAIRANSVQSDGSGGYLTFHTSLGTESEGTTAATKMTLDASGNLLIGGTNNTGITGVGLTLENTNGQSYYRVNNAGLSTSGKTSAYAGLAVGDGSARGFEVIHRGQYSTLSRYGVTVADYSMIETYGTNSNGIIIGTVSAKPIIFGTNSLGRMTLTSGGDLGIGTTTITQPSAGATTLRIVGTVTTKAGAIRLDSSDSSVSAYIYPDSTNGLSINTSTSHPIVFRTAGSERVRITSGGNVLINTTTDAGQRLYVSGTGRFDGQVLISADSANEQFIIRRGSNFNQQLILGYHSSGYGRIQAVEQTVAYRPLALNGDGGNVLIGTYTDGGYKLDVNGTGRFSGQLSMAYSGNPRLLLHDIDSGSGNVGILFRENTSDKWTIASVGGNMQFFNEATVSNAIYITSGNYVGVNSTSPISQLSVKGVGGATGVTLTLENGGGVAALNDPLGIIDFYSNDPSAGASGVHGSLSVRNEFNGNWDGTPSRQNTYMNFSTSASGTVTERMRITSAGNVGIGTTNPVAKLQVNGGISINGSISNTGTGAGTYTQAVWYNNTTDQVLFENGRTTDSASGTGRTVYFTWRGGPSVGGGVQLQHGANAWAAYTSDARLKTVVANVDNGLEAIMKLNPIKYKWTKELETSRTVLGFTAQNVGEAIPEAMFKSWEDEELGDVLSYYQEYLTPYLVKSIQELSTKNDALEARLAALESAQ